ncbi:hypothetical protein [Vibrio sp. A14(2019)]|uniref:hypothetical protein n=1 Tax=Vibrio sp. A14(2019) TaxID=2591428 RepID=UPI0027C54AF9|nr:hypothetical protein [Vibrio sp. A14(2019)]MDQ2194439.1 hypothetical protein [Vibrio sp. A14(2019)]
MEVNNLVRELSRLNDDLLNSKSQLTAAASMASSSAQSAASSDQSAKSHADRARQIAGLETVELAVEAVFADERTAMIAAVLAAISGGKWVVQPDAFGNAQVLYRAPAHTFETLAISGCPFAGVLDCFVRQDGTIRPYVDVPVYQMSNKGGRAVSQANRDPWVSINADVARARCVELGANALMISHEVWAMLCWNMISQGYQPRGNTEFGRSHANINEFGRRTDGRVPNDRAGTARVLTGSGPSAWRHDGTDFGVADMVGNVWEWVDGMKMSGGQFIVADYTGQPEAQWKETGVYISNTGQFTNTPPTTLNSGNQVWGNMPKAPGYAGNEKLQRLIIEPIECTKHLMGRLYWNLDGERFPHRGGSWSSASNAGPAALSCYTPRSFVNSTLGFRAAFVS